LFGRKQLVAVYVLQFGCYFLSATVEVMALLALVGWWKMSN
jgi:hypothetical protein